MSMESYARIATAFIWICSSSGTNRMFHILGEVGAEPKVSMLGPLSLIWTPHTKEARCVCFNSHRKYVNPKE